MILGMTTATYTLIHVLISLVAIVTGFVVLWALISGKQLNKVTTTFLVTTVATSVTGFGFPIAHVTPGIIVGIISLLVLAITIPAMYVFKLSGAWRWIYVVGATLALYF